MTQEALAPIVSKYLTDQGILPGSDEYKSLMQLGMTLAGTAIGSVAGGTQGAASGATAAFIGVTNNRLLHEDEKQRIKELAKGDKELEEKLTRAACYEVKCWAQYPEGSAEWQKNFVSVGESISLANELLAIRNEQQTHGLFTYTLAQQAWDDFRAVPLQAIKNTGKVVSGGVTAYTGLQICASGFGCIYGGPLATFGASEATEGATALYNQYKGNGTSGFNPLRVGFNTLWPVWGDTIYDTGYLVASALSLTGIVPAKIGITPNSAGSIYVSDGISRTNSFFGVTVPRWQNPILNPLSGEVLLTNNGARVVMFYSVGSKAPAIIDDVNKAGGAK